MLKPIFSIASTKFFAEPSIIGSSSEFSSITRLSIPSPQSAAIKCSTVETVTPFSLVNFVQ